MAELIYYRQGLVKKFYLLPRNFLVVNGIVFLIGIDINQTFTKEIVYVLIHCPDVTPEEKEV